MVLNLIFCRGELDDEIHIVGLNLRLVCRLVSDGLAAFFTAVNDDIALLRVGKRAYGTENAAALVGSVAGVYIDVQGGETEGAVISRGVAERLDALAAGGTDEARIVFRKSFRFHFFSLFTYAEARENVVDDRLRDGSSVDPAECAEGYFGIGGDGIRGNACA